MAITDNLIGFWELEETSGNAADSHGSYTLTHNNDPGTATGVQGNCRVFTQYKRLASTSTDLQSGGGNITVAGWIWFDTISSNDIFHKWAFGDTNGEWRVYLDGFNRFAFRVRNAANSGQTERSAETKGVISTTDQWYFFVGWHDADNDQIGIAIDGGTADVTSSYTDGIYSGTAGFSLGDTATGEGTSFAGQIDQVGFWKRVLTSEERTWLYNSGSGRAYSEFAGGQFSRPSSDVADGNWLNEASSATNLYASIDEETASDTDYIVSGATPTNDTCTVGLSTISTPAAGTITMRIRAKYL